MGVEIRYLEQKDISYYHWDLCVSKAVNSSIYGYTWFLNTVTEDWDALVSDDYKMVMPLPLKRSLLGIKLVQPFSCPYLGVYSTGQMNASIVQDFLRSIPRRYGKIDLILNKFNSFNTDNKYINPTIKYELDLIAKYQTIARLYSPELQQKLAQAKQEKITVNEGALPNDFISLAVKSLLDKRMFDTRQIRMIIATSIRYKMGTIYTAYTKHNNLCAAVLMLRDNTRLIKYVSLVTSEGKALGADLMLTDSIIQRHAEKPVTMTFEDVGLLSGEDPAMYGAIKSNYPRYKKWRIMPIFIQ